MELKINIYEKGQVVKTHRTNDYEVELGICEDLVQILHLEKFTEETLKDISVSEVVNTIIYNFDKFIELLHEIFPELTEEERRHIRLTELKDLFVNLAKYTINNLFNLSRKN